MWWELLYTETLSLCLQNKNKKNSDLFIPTNQDTSVLVLRQQPNKKRKKRKRKNENKKFLQYIRKEFTEPTKIPSFLMQSK